LEVTLILITWVAMGKLLHLDDSAYVVAGVPIVAFFQLIIRRQPLRALWIREAPPFRLNSKLVFALPLTVLPSLSTIGAVLPFKPWDCALYVSTVFGAFAAAYALRHLRRQHLRLLILCIIVNELIDAAGWTLQLRMGVWTLRETSMIEKSATGMISFLMGVPLLCMVDEVAFRGAFDSHLNATTGHNWWISALYVSALWAVWHMPVYGPVDHDSLALFAILLPFGMVLSYLWRKTGNLAYTVIIHALSNALFAAIFEQ